MVKDKEDDEEQASQGSQTEGGSGGTGGSGGVIPGYHELFRIDADEKEMAKFASDALERQRISVKSKGYEVTALSKMQKLRHQLQEPGLDAGEGAGLGLEEHPELPELGGEVDPNIVVLPDSELTVDQIRNDPKLRNRLAAKLGMGMGLSIQSMRAEYEKKMKNRMRVAPAPEEKPRYRPVSAPKNRPS